MTTRERRLLGVLVAVVATVALYVGAIQVFGGDLGAPCRDSYSCKGFLVGGAECVAIEVGGVERQAYCTRYCDTRAECPEGWFCVGANPTAMGLETGLVDEVCVRPGS